MCAYIIESIYLVSAIAFILSLKFLAKPDTARLGNYVGILGMGLAIGATFLKPSFTNYFVVSAVIMAGAFVGIIIAKKIPMTSMPELVAGFHSFVGLAAVLVAISAFSNPENFGIGSYGSLSQSALLEMSVGAVIGAITFTGSIIAFAKLQGMLTSKPIKFMFQQYVCILTAALIIYLVYELMQTSNPFIFYALILLASAFGILLIAPVGGADMPVIVSMLNSYSGWAAAGIGFTLNNKLLIITGALVGASGAILSYIMCAAMNRSLFNVIFGAFKAQSETGEFAESEGREPQVANAEEAAFQMKQAENIIIVPGYGMAVAKAQHAIKEMRDLLKKQGIGVKFAIHPVAGRMPGHMNVLLAEANIDYDDVFELEDINSEFNSTDIVLVIGANDITNPAAKTDKSSPIYGMPILEAQQAKTIYFIKRSMASGYAGVQNELFFHNNTYMLFGDAKAIVEEIVKSL